MCRVIALTAAVLLAQVSTASAQPTTVVVNGQLSGGNNVTASCTVGAGGQITGPGALYGVNPANGATYKYLFTITSSSTASGKLVLSGKMAAGPSVTLTCTVPGGPMVFRYVVNGNTYTLSGQGVVTVN